MGRASGRRKGISSTAGLRAAAKPHYLVSEWFRIRQRTIEATHSIKVLFESLVRSLDTQRAGALHLWLISRDGTKKSKRAPHKSLTKTDAYTVTFNDGEQDLRVEATLSQLEGKFVRVQQKIVEKKSLDKWDKAYLAAFMATMYCRTNPFAEGMEEAWVQLDDMVKKVEDVIKNSHPAKLPPPIYPGQGLPISSKDTQYIIRNARPLAVESALQTAAPILWRMSLAFAEAPEGSFFITSDNPCVWFDPTAYRRPPFYRNAGLAMPEVEVTMPISPKFTAIVTHETGMQGYFQMTNWQVQEMNRRTVGFSDRQFISSSGNTLPQWFDPGTPPPDAWENRDPKEYESRNPFGDEKGK